MKAQEQIISIQQILKDGGFYHGNVDGLPGKLTDMAFKECADQALSDYHESQIQVPSDGKVHKVLATSFADPKDVQKFKECKAQGNSDNFCFKKGDNGIGFWGDDTTVTEPICALPPEDWIAKWGKGRNARNQRVLVKIGDQQVICFLRDTMPHKENITNGAGIDLNPCALSALNQRPPAKLAATWEWV